MNTERFTTLATLALHILKPCPAHLDADLIDRGVSEMKDRLQRVVHHDPLVCTVQNLIDAFRIQEGVILPREDKFAILAYYALCGKLDAEQRVIELTMRTVPSIVIGLR